MYDIVLYPSPSPLSHYLCPYLNSASHCLFGNQPKNISVKYASTFRSNFLFRPIWFRLVFPPAFVA